MALLAVASPASAQAPFQQTGGGTDAIPTATAQPSSVAFFYAEKPPLAELQAFDVAVVAPDYVQDPQRHGRAAADGAHQLFAYVALGEVLPSRGYFGELPAGSVRADNRA